MAKPDRESSGVTGVILAGGQGRRMGGRDKGLIEISGSPLIESVINAFAPQVDELIINANRNITDYSQYGYEVIEDELPAYQGPLAGMLASLPHATNDQVVFVPCDTVSLPDDLVARLIDSKKQSNAEVCAAHDGHRLHGIYVLLEKSCIDSLQRYLAAGNRKVEDWLKTNKFSVADFSDMPTCFGNINTPEDL